MKAIEKKYVKLHVPDNMRLANRLKKTLGLHDVEVLTTGHLSEEARKEAICSFAADYFFDKLPENAVVGISGGRYLFNMARGLDIPERFSKVKIVSLAEVGIHETVAASANFIVGLIKMNNPHIQTYALSLPIPADISMNDRKGMENYLKEQNNPRAKEAYQRLFDVTRVFTSLGVLDEQSTFLLELNEGQRNNVKELMEKGEIVGDCMYQIIDSSGMYVELSFLRGQFCGLPLSHLQDMVKEDKHVIVLAGHEKREIVAAALKGKLFNCLICDEETAEFLLNPEEKEQPPSEEELARYYNLPPPR